jgi:hypothetical protein
MRSALGALLTLGRERQSAVQHDRDPSETAKDSQNWGDQCQPDLVRYLAKYRVPRRSPFLLSFFSSIMRMMGSASSLVFWPSALPICSTDWPGFLAT